MQILVLINRNDQHRIGGIENFLCEQQPPLHHREPLAVTIFIRAVDVIIVVLPIARAGVVRRIDVNAIDLALGANVLQQPKRVIILRLDQHMPKRGIGSVDDFVQFPKTRINRRMRECFVMLLENQPEFFFAFELFDFDRDALAQILVRNLLD